MTWDDVETTLLKCHSASGESGSASGELESRQRCIRAGHTVTRVEMFNYGCRQCSCHFLLYTLYLRQAIFLTKSNPSDCQPPDENQRRLAVGRVPFRRAGRSPAEGTRRTGSGTNAGGAAPLLEASGGGMLAKGSQLPLALATARLPSGGRGRGGLLLGIALAKEQILIAIVVVIAIILVAVAIAVNVVIVAIVIVVIVAIVIVIGAIACHRHRHRRPRRRRQSS